ncbi:MAG: PIN domain-containing protein [Acidobacteria bacterium]|nr:PIN domain-containing protein [Acidobacteriota bacterium]
MLNLDTHILIHALNGKLKPRERRLLAENAWSISAIVLWEVAKLSQIGRIELAIESAPFRRLIAPVHIWPLDMDVYRHIGKLDFRSDPADEIIAATSVEHAIPLLTRDERIRQSTIVPLA